MYKLFANTVIETVQSAKKVAVDTFVKHEGLAKSLTDFVDAQTEYTKKFVDASVDAGTKVATTLSTPKFYEDAFKNAQAQVETLFPTSKKGK
jgi:hypothetical protein